MIFYRSNHIVNYEEDFYSAFIFSETIQLLIDIFNMIIFLKHFIERESQNLFSFPNEFPQDQKKLSNTGGIPYKI